MMTPSKAKTTTTRSRRSAPSIIEEPTMACVRKLRRHPFGRLHNMGQRTVATLRFELDGTRAFDVRGCNFAFDVLEPFRHHNPNSVRRSCDRVFYGLDVGFKHSRDAELSVPGFFIKFEGDGREDRVVHLRHNQRNDMEKRTFRGVLPRHNFEQCFPLLRSSAFVDDRLQLAVAFMEGPWETHHGKE